MMARGGGYGIDDEGVQYMAGYIDGMTKTVETSQYIGSVITYVHGQLAPQFDRHIDRIAKGSPSRFHHVYEWPTTYGGHDTIGQPAARLWRQTLAGHGKSKTAGFKFVASKRAVPVHPLAATPNEKTGKHVRIGFHVFYWKAAVMEFGIDVSISPTLGQWLALVVGRNNGFLAFTQKTIEMQGGTAATRGSFTRAFYDWWNTDAVNIYDERIAPNLAKDLVAAGSLSQRTGRMRVKEFSIGTGSRSEAYQRAQAKAVADMNKNQREYILGSLERMSNLGRL